MKLQTIFMMFLLVGLIACDDDDDTDMDDMNQVTVGENSQITAEIEQNGTLVTEFEVASIAGAFGGGLISLNTATGDGFQSLNIVLAPDNGVEDTYQDDDDDVQPSEGTAQITYINEDIQNGMIFESESGEVEISNYEKVGENATGVYYEMDGTFNVTAASASTQQEVEITGAIEDAFITEPK